MNWLKSSIVYDRRTSVSSHRRWWGTSVTSRTEERRDRYSSASSLSLSLSLFSSPLLCPFYLRPPLPAFFLPPSLFLSVTHPSEISSAFPSFPLAFSILSNDPSLLQYPRYFCFPCLPLIPLPHLFPLMTLSFAVFVSPTSFFPISKVARRALVLAKGGVSEHTATFSPRPRLHPASLFGSKTLTKPPLGT